MPKKGYKQTLEHIEKAAEARKGKLIGRNNPAYVVIDELKNGNLSDTLQKIKNFINDEGRANFDF